MKTNGGAKWKKAKLVLENGEVVWIDVYHGAVKLSNSRNEWVSFAPSMSANKVSDLNHASVMTKGPVELLDSDNL